MPTPEWKIKQKVKALLKVHKAYWHMPVQNGMGAPSLDFIGCHRGLYYGIETKAGSKGPTPRQETTMVAIRRAGGSVFLINEETGIGELIDWLTRNK